MFKKFVINLLGFNEDEVEDISSVSDTPLTPTSTVSSTSTIAPPNGVNVVNLVLNDIGDDDVEMKAEEAWESWIEDEDFNEKVNLDGTLNFDAKTEPKTSVKRYGGFEPVRRRIDWRRDPVDTVESVRHFTPSTPYRNTRDIFRFPRDSEPGEDHSRNIVKSPAVTIVDSEAGEGPFMCDVVFSFDTTGSMSSVIDSVRQNLTETVDRLFMEIPGIRIGIIAHGDYCDYPNLMWKLDLTRDIGKIHNFITTAKSTGGGDCDECYELVLETAKSMRWASEVKVLVVIGDAAPHEVGYRHQKMEYLSDVETPLKLDWRTITGELAQSKVVIFSCHANPRDGNIKEGEFYKTISSETGGYYLKLNELQAFKEYMVGICLKAADGAEDLAILRERQEQIKKEIEELQQQREHAKRLEAEKKELEAKLREENDAARRTEILSTIRSTQGEIETIFGRVDSTFREINEEENEIKSALNESFGATPFIPSINSTASKLRTKTNKKTRSEMYEEELFNKFHCSRFSDLTTELKSAKCSSKPYNPR